MAGVNEQLCTFVVPGSAINTFTAIITIVPSKPFLGLVGEGYQKWASQIVPMWLHKHKQRVSLIREFVLTIDDYHDGDYDLA